MLKMPEYNIEKSKNFKLPIPTIEENTEEGTSQKSMPIGLSSDDIRTEAVIVVPPDGGWGWVIVICAFLTFFISDGIVYTFGIFLEDISKTFHCTKSQVSLIGGLMTGFFCLSGPFTAALVNRYGYRKVSIAGSFLASASCLLTSFSSSLCVIYITYGVIGGIGFGMIYVPAVIVVGFYFERWRALATSIAVCGAGIGGTALPPILTLVTEAAGWQYTFRVLAILTLGNIFCGLMFRPIKPTKIKLKEEIISFSSVTTIDTENKSSFFGSYHNTCYPKIADINTISTVTLFQLVKLPQNTSSELITSSSVRNVKMDSSLFPNYSAKCIDSKLPTVFEEERVNKCRLRCKCCKITNWFRIPSIGRNFTRRFQKQKNSDNAPMRPMYRDDIFYSGSIIYLPEYQKSFQATQQRSLSSAQSMKKEQKSKATTDYNLSVNRIATQKDLNEQNKCALCPDAIKRTLATMLDVSLLKSPSFICLGFNAIFTSMGVYTPYMFIKDRAILNGMSNDTAFWLISAIGVTNTFGRIMCGILTSFPQIKASWVSYISLIIGGVATALSGLTFNVCVQFLYSSVFGMSIACLSALRTILIVEILGLENLTNAMGIILMFQGVASLAGTALSGVLTDLSGDYQYSFYFAGGSLTIGALFLIPIKTIAEWEKNKKLTDTMNV